MIFTATENVVNASRILLVMFALLCSSTYKINGQLSSMFVIENKYGFLTFSISNTIANIHIIAACMT